MRVTKNKITSFTSHNLTKKVTDWSSGLTYLNGVESNYGDYIYTYAGADDTNTSGTPDVEDNWVKTRANNIHSMLDQRPSSESYENDKIEFTFISEGFDKLALFNVVANSVTVEVTSLWDSSVTKTITENLLNTELITDLREFCTAELEQESLVYINLPIIHSCSVKVTIDNTGGIARCGLVISGKSFYVGSTGWDIRLGLTSYSKKDVDVFGNTDFIKRGITDADDFLVTIDTNKASLIKQKFKEYDADFLLFSILEGENITINFGFWEDFYVLLSSPVKSEANISIRGVL